MYKISIIIPVYNVEKYLDKCIKSIVCQEYQNIEIILIDDGSIDNSSRICDIWAKEDKRIKVIHKSNGGVSSARNEGLKQATGDYITFIDGDDYITPEFSFLINQITDEDVVCVPYLESINDIVTIKIPKTNWINKKIYNINKGKVINGIYNSSCFKIFKSRVIKDNNLKFDTNYKIAEDLKFSFEAIAGSKKISFIGVPYYIYVRNNTSAMAKISYEKITDTLEVCKLCIKNLYKIVDKNKKKFLIKLISENLLSVFKRLNNYTTEQNLVLYKELKALKNYISYGSSFVKKLLVLSIKVFGIKISSKIAKILLKG